MVHLEAAREQSTPRRFRLVGVGCPRGLKLKPANTELVLTGRGAPESFRAMADLVTEMTLVKHYFYHGVPAREGLDY